MNEDGCSVMLIPRPLGLKRPREIGRARVEEGDMGGEATIVN